MTICERFVPDGLCGLHADIDRFDPSEVRPCGALLEQKKAALSVQLIKVGSAPAADGDTGERAAGIGHSARVRARS